MDALITLLITMVVFVVFDIVALRWGVDSRDSLDSKEWKRRNLWADRLTASHKPITPLYAARAQQHAGRMNGHAPVLP